MLLSPLVTSEMKRIKRNMINVGINSKRTLSSHSTRLITVKPAGRLMKVYRGKKIEGSNSTHEEKVGCETHGHDAAEAKNVAGFKENWGTYPDLSIPRAIKGNVYLIKRENEECPQSERVLIYQKKKKINKTQLAAQKRAVRATLPHVCSP